MSNTNEKVVVDLNNFHGNPYSVLYDGVCPYDGKTEADYLAEGYSIMSREDFTPIREKYLDSLCGQWQKISEEDYDSALDMLPPLRWTNGGFYFMERYNADVTMFYQKWYGKHYSSMQRLSYKRKDVINSLEAFIKAKRIAKENATEERKAMKKLILTHVGRDSWDRPVYECEGQLYVDVDPRESRSPEIHTKQGNAFNGEPLSPITADFEIEFVPQRDTWNF